MYLLFDYIIWTAMSNISLRYYISAENLNAFLCIQWTQFYVIPYTRLKHASYKEKYFILQNTFFLDKWRDLSNIGIPEKSKYDGLFLSG